MSEVTVHQQCSCAAKRELTGVVGTDLQSLVATHNKADLLALLVSEKTNFTGSALLPLEIVLCETEELGTPEILLDLDRWVIESDVHLEECLLVLLVSLGLDLLGELVNGLEVDIGLLLGLTC